jgi:hypothetical protein
MQPIHFKHVLMLSFTSRSQADNKLRSIRGPSDDVAVDLILTATRTDRALSFDAVTTAYSPMRIQWCLRFLYEKVLTNQKTKPKAKRTRSNQAEHEKQFV